MAESVPRFTLEDAGNGAETRAAGLRALASVLVQRAEFAARAGITFGGLRDLYRALGYKRDLEPKDFLDRYARGDLAGRVVDAFPEATWSRDIELIEDDDPTTFTAFEEAWTELAARLRVWQVFERADRLAGLGKCGFSVILIGAEGELANELPRFRGPEGVLYLSAFGEQSVRIDALELDSRSPRFGRPTKYKLTMAGAGSQQALERSLHWTRAVHVVHNPLEDEVLGYTLLRRVWNRLDDIDKVLGGSAEAFWRTADRGLHANLDKDFTLPPGEPERIEQEFEQYIHGISHLIRTQGMDVTPLGSDVADPKGSFEANVAAISGATGIPQRIFMGSERGELASTQDQHNWNERISQRRSKFGEPTVRTFADRLIERNALPRPTQYFIRWPFLESLNELQKSEAAQRTANAALAISNQLVPIVAPSEARERLFDLPADLPEDARAFFFDEAEPAGARAKRGSLIAAKRRYRARGAQDEPGPVEDRVIRLAPRRRPTRRMLRAVRSMEIRARRMQVGFGRRLRAVFRAFGREAARLAERGWTRAEAESRIAAQLSREDRRAIAAIMRELPFEDLVETLTDRYGAHFQTVARGTFEDLNTALGLATDLPDEVAREMLRLGGSRRGLVDLEGQTREKLFNLLADAREDGLGVDAIVRKIRDEVPAGPYASPSIRAEVLARTETKVAQNHSVLKFSRESGAKKAMVFDARLGATDETCEALDGKIVSLEDAERLVAEEHPSGTRSFTPWFEE